MADKRPRKIEDESGGIPEWVVTFGDMMSLLLTFFIMLYSMSVMETQITQEVVIALTRKFGHEKTIVSVMPGRHAPTNATIGRPSSMGRAQLKDILRGGDKVKAPVGDHPRVQTVREADNTSLSGVVYFGEGSDELTEQDRQRLDQYYRDIAGKQNIVEIRGHTAAQPLGENSPYRNHWDLAYSRGYRVMQYLVELGIDPKRIRLSVSASNEPPRIDGSTKARHDADRVEVFLRTEFASEFQGTPAERRMRYTTGGVP